MHTITRRLFFVGLASSVTTSALAHHGFSGRYNLAAPIWIEGEVERATFAPPHPILSIRVATDVAPEPPKSLPHGLSIVPIVRPADAGTIVDVEFPPVGTFYRMGSAVRAGDRVTIIALENCQPPNQLRSQWVRTSSGTIITRDRRMSYMVSGCEEN